MVAGAIFVSSPSHNPCGSTVRNSKLSPVNLDVVLALRKMRSKELAERVGISEQNLSRLKIGKTKQISFDTLAKICEALECQPGGILEARSRSE